ncbi:hypothetical protein [Anaerococcus rubeinfantis]|uniref:hypothetical protein n=1 Tax=Anaerococcus rubeinfantis TaxID=1720199 RepID=UPI00073EE346|nr:hypothetical protein [Anaerococcus rubeinfantis]
MKTKEFIKRVEELGFKAHKIVTQIDIIANGFVIAKVYTNRMYSINAFNFLNIQWKNQDKLFDLIVEYAKTPIDEREEEDKYFYEHRFIKTRGGNPTYLAIRQRPNRKYPILQGSYKDIFEDKVEFTDKEMEEVKNQYYICLDDFVKKGIIEE